MIALIKVQTMAIWIKRQIIENFTENRESWRGLDIIPCHWLLTYILGKPIQMYLINITFIIKV